MKPESVSSLNHKVLGLVVGRFECPVRCGWNFKALIVFTNSRETELSTESILPDSVLPAKYRLVTKEDGGAQHFSGVDIGCFHGLKFGVVLVGLGLSGIKCGFGLGKILVSLVAFNLSLTLRIMGHLAVGVGAGALTLTMSVITKFAKCNPTYSLFGWEFAKFGILCGWSGRRALVVIPCHWFDPLDPIDLKVSVVKRPILQLIKSGLCLFPSRKLNVDPSTVVDGWGTIGTTNRITGLAILHQTRKRPCWAASCQVAAKLHVQVSRSFPCPFGRAPGTWSLRI